MPCQARPHLPPSQQHAHAVGNPPPPDVVSTVIHSALSETLTRDPYSASQRDADQETIKELAASVRGLVRFMRELGTHFGIDTSSLDAPSGLLTPSPVPSPSDSTAGALRGLSIRGGSRGSSANSSINSHSGLFPILSLYMTLITHRSWAWSCAGQCSEWVWAACRRFHSGAVQGDQACGPLVITISFFFISACVCTKCNISRVCASKKEAPI
jgi:hypothetical protein